MIVTIGDEQVPLGGDIVLTVAGIPASAANLARIREVMRNKAPGIVFKMTALRAGRVLDLTGRLP